MPISMLRPTRAKHNASLQSRNTPRTDAPPLAPADDPSSTPMEWLTPPFKEQFLASNDKALLKKGDTATTSMVRREALTGPSSVCLASCTAGVVSGALVASLSSRTNASPCTFQTAFPAGTEEPPVAAVARKESKIPRQKSAIPAKGRSRRSARLLPPPPVRLPTCRASSPSGASWWLECTFTPSVRQRAGPQEEPDSLD